MHFLREHREAELADDALAQDSAAQTKLRELAIIRAADAVLPHSDTEIALLDEEAPETPAFKLPLIYDPEPIAAGFHRREGIGFLGGFGHPPNVDASTGSCQTSGPRCAPRSRMRALSWRAARCPIASRRWMARMA
ncbi:MAG: hypothetical protein JKP95_03065 [Oceanicaulis sp.]|nr:hypothetical protein [Oceanicaulis sp.]